MREATSAWSAVGIDWTTHHVHAAALTEDGMLDMERLYCCGSPEAVLGAVRSLGERHWQCAGVFSACPRPSNGRAVRICIRAGRYRAVRAQ